MNFDEVIQLQVLKLKSMAVGRGPITEALLESADVASVPVLRQMCAKVSAPLYDDLENTCKLLDMSKREFIESAVSDALQRAHEVINRSGVMDDLSLSRSA